jgi:hypothetical protein
LGKVIQVAIKKNVLGMRIPDNDGITHVKWFYDPIGENKDSFDAQ